MHSLLNGCSTPARNLAGHRGKIGKQQSKTSTMCRHAYSKELQGLILLTVTNPHPYYGLKGPRSNITSTFRFRRGATLAAKVATLAARSSCVSMSANPRLTQKQRCWTGEVSVDI
jgi:hypothetical protein